MGGIKGWEEEERGTPEYWLDMWKKLYVEQKGRNEVESQAIEKRASIQTKGIEIRLGT